MRPAVWAPWPRDLCLRIEPSTVVSLCRFSKSSSRSLGHSLLLVKEPYEPTYCHNRHPSYRSAEGFRLALLCGCQVANTRMLLIPPMTLLLPHPRETGCYTWHGTKSVTLTWDAPRCWAP